MHNSTILLFVFFSIFHTVKAQVELPEWIQNKKWVGISKYNEQYYQGAIGVVFITDTDTVEYVGSEGSSFGDRWQVKEIEETKNGLKLYNDKVANQFFEFSWIDKDRQIGKWEKSYNTDDYCEDYEFLVVDSAYYHLLGDLVIDDTSISDVFEYVNFGQRIDSIFDFVTVDYNRDGIKDNIVAYKKWTYEDDINQSHRYYQIFFFEGNKDGTFNHQYSIAKKIQKPGKLVGVSAKKNTCQLFISNVVDEKNYDPFVEGLETELSDFEEIRSINETYQYNRNKKEWTSKSTKENIIKR